MSFDEIFEFFGSRAKLAKLLNIDRANMSMWVKAGVIPAAHAIAIERLSEGKFKAVDMTKESLF